MLIKKLKVRCGFWNCNKFYGKVVVVEPSLNHPGTATMGDIVVTLDKSQIEQVLAVVAPIVVGIIEGQAKWMLPVSAPTDAAGGEEEK
jgi:hypothetical protein